MHLQNAHQHDHRGALQVRREIELGALNPRAVAAEEESGQVRYCSALVRYCSAFTAAYLLVHFVDAIAGRRIETTRRCFVDLHKNEVVRFASRLRQLRFEPVQSVQKYAFQHRNTGSSVRVGMCSDYLFAEPTKHPHSRVLYKLSRQILSVEVCSRAPDEYVLLSEAYTCCQEGW